MVGAPEGFQFTLGLIGVLGLTELSLLRDWKAMGFNTTFVHVNEPSSRFARAIATHYLHIPNIGKLADGAARKIAEFLEATETAGFTAMYEPTIVSTAMELRRIGGRCKAMASGSATFGALESKGAQVELARKAGLDVLATVVAAIKDLPGKIEGIVEYPIVLRPNRTTKTIPFKVAVCHSCDELDDVLRTCLDQTEEVIAQPFLRGPNLLVHAFRSPDASDIDARGFDVPLKYRGFSIALSCEEIPPYLRVGLYRFCEMADVTGVFHFDMIRDLETGCVYFLEINPRIGASTPKVSVLGWKESEIIPRLFFRALNVPMCEKDIETRLICNKLHVLRALKSGLAGKSSATDYPYPDRVGLARVAFRFLLTGRDEGGAIRSGFDRLRWYAHRFKVKVSR